MYSCIARLFLHCKIIWKLNLYHIFRASFDGVSLLKSKCRNPSGTRKSPWRRWRRSKDWKPNRSWWRMLEAVWTTMPGRKSSNIVVGNPPIFCEDFKVYFFLLLEFSCSKWRIWGTTSWRMCGRSGTTANFSSARIGWWPRRSASKFILLIYQLLISMFYDETHIARAAVTAHWWGLWCYACCAALLVCQWSQ